LACSKNNTIFALLILIILGHATLGICESKVPNRYGEQILEKLSQISSPSLSHESDDKCDQLYSKLYDNGAMRFSFFLGAVNTQNNVCLDPQTKHALVEYLIRDCQPNFFACGFSKKSNDPTILRKTTDSKTIIITIYDSSVSEDLKKNVAELASEQQIKSEQVTEAFLKSIETDDVIFYLGHSRYGTGPGFYHLPFLSTQRISTFILSPLRSAMIRKLDESFSSPQVLGLFGCNSQRYYASEIHAVAPEMALVVSTGITTYESNIVQAMAMLNLLLGNACLEEFNIALKELDENSKYKFYGLYQDNTFPQFKRHNSILSITIFILVLPIIIMVPKLYPTGKFSPLEIQSFARSLSLLLFSCVFSLIAVRYLSKVNNEFYKQSILLFFLLMGAVLFGMLSFGKQTKFRDIILTLRFSLPLLTFLGLVYFGINLYPKASFKELFISFLQSTKFLILFAAFLPFSAITTATLEYPLFAKWKRSVGFRIIIFVVISELFCLMVAYSLTYLNMYLVPYRNLIFFSLFYIQVLSMLLYYYKSSTFLPIVLQSLTFAIIFSENIHGLF
jgi:hypothetical protein